MEKEKWLMCPVCNGKTRTKLRQNTTLTNFPLFCPKCKKETIVDIQQDGKIIIKEPDAKTQSR